MLDNRVSHFVWVYPRVGGGAASCRYVKEAGRGLSPRGRGSHTATNRNSLASRSIPAWAGEPRHPFRRQEPVQVYPRVGGGAVNLNGHPILREGLSPRGRGSHRRQTPCRSRLGSIPAWAGEPHDESEAIAGDQVYPRVGGGAVRCSIWSRRHTGLSPRGRGSPPGACANMIGKGSIPAWAGEPATTSLAVALRTVYPRVGGGALAQLHSVIETTGLSPRGRGSLSSSGCAMMQLGSIPAWAGEPLAHNTLILQRCQRALVTT